VKLLVINPNTSTHMTTRLVDAVRSQAGPAVSVRGVTARFGAPVIASRASFAIGAHAALDAWQADAAAGNTPDAVLLACFGDPGLQALREVAGVPVIGLAQACLQQVLREQRPFAIVTAGAAWRDMLGETVRLAQADGLLRAIEVLDTTGLAIAEDPGAHLARTRQAIDHARRAGAQTIILGGAGFVGLADTLRSDAVRLMDGLEVATHAAMTAAGALSRS
jgi:Asp/Glu/hydantoin racemase